MSDVPNQRLPRGPVAVEIRRQHDAGPQNLRLLHVFRADALRFDPLAQLRLDDDGRRLPDRCSGRQRLRSHQVGFQIGNRGLG